uniref:Putative secreted protein n=1 Tax=Lutzomyia longipalpis TaxID=7200 RepID=A0A7G3ALI3_LUTLO
MGSVKLFGVCLFFISLAALSWCNVSLEKDPRCPRNEHYSFKSDCNEPCAYHTAHHTKQEYICKYTEKYGCFCNYGFKRNSDKKCIPEAEC